MKVAVGCWVWLNYQIGFLRIIHMQFRKLPSTAAVSIVLLTGVTGQSDAAAQYQVLHTFCSDGCGDGENPNALIEDSTGNLYGTTSRGGANGFGIVFELVPGSRGQYKYKILYNFCSATGCSDGAAPYSALVIDTSGNLYGTTVAGGKDNDGEVFELERKRGGWNLKTLYSFCSSGGFCKDGSAPVAGLTYSGAAANQPYDGSSALFGTTDQGGATDAGTAYQILPSSGHWKHTVLHDFCTHGGCRDGSDPAGGLVEDASGNLYGTTFAGGANLNDGVFFELTETGGRWSEAVLYNLCSRKNCADGAGPFFGMALIDDSNLLGFTPGGGARGGNKCDLGGSGCGVAFELSQNGGGWAESVTYTFCTAQKCADGGEPWGEPALDQNGNIFGVTVEGGEHKYNGGRAGTLFEISSLGYHVLYDFCSMRTCSDGGHPQSLIRDSSGRLFGTTSLPSVVFEYSPQLRN